MRQPPILFFAFANEQDRHLGLLKAESSSIYNILFPLEEAGKLLIAREESLNTEELFLAFRRFKDRMVIFHYAGHAGGNALVLEDQTASAGSLAQLIAEQKDTLKVVFLNGCATLEQVKRLHELGIKAVIATSTPIEDNKAQLFAEKFYQALSDHYTLQDAFTHARSFVSDKLSQEPAIHRGIQIDRGASDEFPWGLYALDDTDLKWKIDDPFLSLKDLREASVARHQELKDGSFRYLKIEDALLKDIRETQLVEEQSMIQVEVAYKETRLPLEEAVESLWTAESPHVLLIGAGGMGKTVSLVHLWEYFLDLQKPDQPAGYVPIPLYVALDEANDSEDAGKPGFIRRLVRKYYLDADLAGILKTAEERKMPKILLLLDGINDVRPENLPPIIEELSQILNPKNYPHLQVVLTARDDLRDHYAKQTWTTFLQPFYLQLLTPRHIQEYLGQTGPISPELLNLLRTPMMLTIYKASTQVSEKLPDKAFKTDITSVGELLHNVEVMTRLALQERFQRNQKELVFQRFILEHLLPWIAWHMYRSRINLIPRKEPALPNLKAVAEAGIQTLLNEDFYETFDRQYDRYLDERRFDLPSRQLFNQVVREVCVEKLTILVEEGDAFRFLHNLLRDYFAARHVLNEIDLALMTGNIPAILRDNEIDPYLARMIGQIEGEHRINPAQYALNPAMMLYQSKPNRLARLLDACRGNFKEAETGQTIGNLIRIMAINRGELTGADLHLLDLRQVSLNGIRLWRWGKRPVSANLFGARITRNTFFPNPNAFRKNFLRLSPCSQRVLFASRNGWITEWEISTETCIASLQCPDKIEDVQYSYDGKLAIIHTGSTIEEWNLYTTRRISIHPPEEDGSKCSPTDPLDHLCETTQKQIGKLRTLSGLLVQGCSFQNIHPSSQLSEEDQEMLQQYGAVFTQADLEKWDEVVGRFYVE